MKKIIIKKDSYYDSVRLMEITAAIKRFEKVRQAAVAMGNAQNLKLIVNTGFEEEKLRGVSAGDLVIAIATEDEESLISVEKKVEELLRSSQSQLALGRETTAADISGALRQLEGANLALISVPGAYAWYEAQKALQAGLNVMLFSDNVPMEREVELKKFAVPKGLIVMGPDCGTAVIGGVPLGFANEVRRGRIGIVGATGSGLQQLMVLIDELGAGVSHAIGTGGRDLSREVGGIATLQAIEALCGDPQTEVIVSISKPPDNTVAEKIIGALATIGKPSVVCFIGSNHLRGGTGISFAATIEEAALKSVSILTGKKLEGEVFRPNHSRMVAVLREHQQKRAPGQKYIRGFFAGGTLCYESLFILSKSVDPLFSNIHPDTAQRLADPEESRGHCLVDLGDDAFTTGRPHPMIDPQARIERIKKESDDPEIAVMLLDIMLGWGAHPDPAGVVLPAIEEAATKAKRRGGLLTVLATVVGTDADFQNASAQRKKLEAAGVIVLRSNASMTEAALIATGGES